MVSSSQSNVSRNDECHLQLKSVSFSSLSLLIHWLYKDHDQALVCRGATDEWNLAAKAPHDGKPPRNEKRLQV